MKKRKMLLFIFLLFSIKVSFAQNSIYKIKTVIPHSVTPFDLTEVKLNDGPFKKAMELDEKYLLELDPDRLLCWFRKEAGLKPKAEVYGGWESDQLAGHTLGHYLSACSMMYASTGNIKLLERIKYIVDELDICQQANGNGYLSAIPGGKQLFKEISDGNIISKKTSGFRLNGIWSPWYTVHKLFAGLLDAQRYCGNEKALEIAKKMGDWAWNTTEKLTRDEFQKMLICEYGGMNEAMAELYARTGNKKYLQLAEKFFDDKVLLPLENQQDSLDGLHSNTQIPKIIGLLRIYELTGKKEDLGIAEFFWKTVVKHHSYVIGGNSENEYFGKADNLSARLDSNTCETCNTYNMLKLTRTLFTISPKQEYADFYERALYNHILASQNSKSGMMCYFVPLEPGAYKTYSTPYNDFWCCVGSGMENHSKYGRNIYFHNNDSLYVNLFIPSSVNWKDKEVTISQQTDFPASGKTRFTFQCKSSVNFSFLVRYPAWCNEEITVRINNKKINPVNNTGSFLKMTRTWKNGDIVTIDYPVSLHLESMKDDKNKAAIMYGPIVLAGKLGPVDDPEGGKPGYIPAFVTNGRNINEWIKPVNKEELKFVTVNTGMPRNVEFVPFYKAQNFRYSVYWDFLTKRQWDLKSEEIAKEKAEIKRLNNRSIDFVQPSDTLSEVIHNYKGENTGTGEEKADRWRAANNGGWISYELKVAPGNSNKLVCKYWGGITKERNFNIMIDGKELTNQKLLNDSPGKFIYVTYLLDKNFTEGKDKITIKFTAPEKGIAGGIFGVWTTE